MSRSVNALLTVTDGTKENTASMLVKTGGASLTDWLPKSPGAASEIWSSTPYGDGKQLVSKTFDNILDTFILQIEAKSIDKTIDELHKFLKLLNKAVAFWTEEYNTHKFWLEARSECETNIRYALVVNYALPEANNPYALPFEEVDETGGTTSTLDELSLSIEHTIWSNSLTLGDTCAALSDGDGTLGITNICGTAAPGAIAGYKTEGITHAFYCDSLPGPATYGPNQVTNALAEHDILGPTPNVGDYLYIGRESDGAVPQPFNNFCTWLAALGTDGGTDKYEYWDGGAWQTLTHVNIELNGFARNTTQLGFHIVIWDMPSNWAEVAINGVTALWIRYVVDNNGITSPRQKANIAIYSIYWPDVFVEDDAVKGDIPAVLNYMLMNYGYHNKLVVALKSDERTNGGKFTPYLPCRSAGFTIPDALWDLTGALVTEVTDMTCYAGRHFDWSPAGVVPNSILFSAWLGTKTYCGRFHVYMRTHILNGAAGLMTFNLGLTTYMGTFIGESVANGVAATFDEWIDLGDISFPQELAFEADSPNYKSLLTIYGSSAGAGQVVIYDLVLIPTDEGTFEIYNHYNIPNENMGEPYKVVCSNPKTGPYCVWLASSSHDLDPAWDDQVRDEFLLSILGASTIKPEEKYHFYFFPMCTAYATGYKLIKQVTFPIIDLHQRYEFLRGAG